MHLGVPAKVGQRLGICASAQAKSKPTIGSRFQNQTFNHPVAQFYIMKDPKGELFSAASWGGELVAGDCFRHPNDCSSHGSALFEILVDRDHGFLEGHIYGLRSFFGRPAPPPCSLHWFYCCGGQSSSHQRNKSAWAPKVHQAQKMFFWGRARCHLPRSRGCPKGIFIE